MGSDDADAGIQLHDDAKDDEEVPAPPMATEGGYHIFLSHVWGTGQDQCATIKRQLCLLLPGVSVFLDVDDLDDISQ